MIIKDAPEFGTKSEKIAWLVSNKEKLIKMAKETPKHADGFSFISIGRKSGAAKAEGDVNKTELQAELIINTTNLMDHHDDVHLPGLWDKSLQENKYIMLLKQHDMGFESIIADETDLEAMAKTYSWKELGFDYPGSTQALQFNALIKQERNSYMFEQYRKGYVKQHSVGMRYVRLILAVNDESYGAEYDAWNKYYPEIANKERADDRGYFWAVPEAKVIEGSAVPLGSNWATPTRNIKSPAPVETTQGPQPSPQISTKAITDFIHESFKNLKV